jgi:DNA-binding LacI/PurR family transcriptional regulator
MKDIAERGNVSLATVSQVLRGRGAHRYSQATRNKIVRVANELGWSPNRLVRGIQTGRTGMAGLVMITSGEHWQRLAIGLQIQLLAHDLVPLVLQPDYSAGSNVSELQLLQNLMELRVEGIVCWPLTDRAATDYLSSVCSKQVPVVTLDFELPDAANAVNVRTPEHKAMAAALDHLMVLGHKRIGYLGFATPGNWVVDRRDAFVQEMAARGLEAVFIKEISKGDSPSLVQLDSDLRKVTAVVAATEQLSVSVWQVAQNAGIHIPTDLSIVGFGQFHFDFALWPKFTSINQHPEKMGRAAATLLVDSAARERARRQANASGRSAVPHIEVEPTLDVGQTTAPPHRRKINHTRSN